MSEEKQSKVFVSTPMMEVECDRCDGDGFTQLEGLIDDYMGDIDDVQESECETCKGYGRYFLETGEKKFVEVRRGK